MKTILLKNYSKPIQRWFQHISLCIIVFIVQTGIGQNLIQNGDFENYYSCPDAISQLSLAENWFDPTLATSDYFNVCDSGNIVSVPTNFMGYQPAQSGNAYAGIFVAQTGGPVYREYLETSFTEQLITGWPYALTFYANISDLSSCDPNSVCAYISTSILSDYTTTAILAEPADVIHTLCSDPDNYFDSIAKWEKIYTCFIATGEENYITIGNSFSDYYSGCIDDGGGSFKTAYLYIDNIILQKLDVQIVYFDTSICKGNNVIINATSFIEEPDNSSPEYTWNDGTHDPVKTLSEEGLHEVYIQNGCVTDTLKINLHFKEDCPEIFIIPNAFSPNNDGVNDKFRISEENITVQRFEIYNRWGIKVFEGTDAASGWDGTIKGHTAEIGVYLYILEYSTNITERSESKKGYVTLIH